MLSSDSTDKSCCSVFPSINLKETIFEFVIEIAIPGYKRDEVSVRMADNVIIVESILCSKAVKSYVSKEFEQYAFRKFLQLEASLDGTKAVATFSNGILIITIPKNTDAR